MHEAGHSNPLLWDNPEGWGADAGGGSGWWDTRTPMADSCWCMENTTIIL